MPADFLVTAGRAVLPFNYERSRLLHSIFRAEKMTLSPVVRTIFSRIHGSNGGAIPNFPYGDDVLVSGGKYWRTQLDGYYGGALSNVNECDARFPEIQLLRVLSSYTRACGNDSKRLCSTVEIKV